MGVCGLIINIFDNRRLNFFVNVEWIYDDKCFDLLVEFFDKRRK